MLNSHTGGVSLAKDTSAAMLEKPNLRQTCEENHIGRIPGIRPQWHLLKFKNMVYRKNLKYKCQVNLMAGESVKVFAK